LSLDRFIEAKPKQIAGFLVEDCWSELNLDQLDVTMGQKGVQRELQRRYGVNGGYTNTDLRRTTSNGAHPHIQADFQHLPFRSGHFKIILFDPPFLVDRRSLSGHDYRRRYFQHYTVQVNKSGHAASIGENYGLWISREQLRKQLYAAFTELRRILHPNGRIIFKWTDSDATLKYALSLKNGLVVEKTMKRKSGYRLKASATTYYVWLRR